MDKITFILLCLCNIAAVNAHGYMCNPAARNALVQCGFPGAPKNDNWMANNAGGPSVVYPCPKKFSPCGDPMGGPWDSMPGGKYDIGVPSQNYSSGESIVVDVILTANHKGVFEFVLWDHDMTKELAFLGAYQISESINTYKVPLMLPKVSCEMCNLQWHWVTGNSPGADPEEFWNCAWISIN